MAAAEFKPDWVKTLKNKGGDEELAGKRLDMPAFFASMEALALGYTAVGVRQSPSQLCVMILFMISCSQVWPYVSARAHIRVLHEVAANASHDDKKRRHVLAQFYDEQVRGDWQEQAKRGKFSIILLAGVLDRDALDAARLEYDNHFAPKAKEDAYELPEAPYSSGYSKRGMHPRVPSRCRVPRVAGVSLAGRKRRGSQASFAGKTWKKQKKQSWKR